ncbi:hypothetical protein [Spongiactinospora sp. TRM90649]|uniref:hypothetical protein n=1 Tax=Spongiactinospora sp. TRM90649 TaxID=3031114 RepID=UPI0023F9B795|nr:hypothetical protein [Spongiactinospora sp. TRM90649]MDF5753118.1 hypothetical protein [Spongiactinospora sp. TRM90649]
MEPRSDRPDDPHRVRPIPPAPYIALPPRGIPAPGAPTVPAEPAVHIGIGRIEVRAVPAPAVPAPAPEPQAPAASGVSLADYLRGDDGGPR